MMAIELSGMLIAVVTLVIAVVSVVRSRRQPPPSGWFLHDGPLVAVHVLGAWIFLPFGVGRALAYGAFTVGTSVWFMTCVCPHCVSFGRENGMSVFCHLSRRLASKGDRQLFPRRFRLNFVVMGIESLLPIVAGVTLVCRSFGSGWRFGYDLFLFVSFGVIAFYLLPSACQPGCKECEMRSDCPWGSQWSSGR